MRRLIALAAGAILLLLVPCNAQSIRDIDITAKLLKDGTANITQVWDVDVVSGTEWYVPVSNLNGMEISGLTVSENGRKFVSEGYGWDIDRSISAKEGRCGIVRKGHDAVELCWGVGSYGSHVWTVSYTVSGLVQGFSDADGFNFMFVNPGMIAYPQHAKVTVINETGGPKWTYDNTRVWGFGFYGDINVEDGTVVAESSEPFERRSSLIALVRFEKGLFAPSLRRDMSFEELKEKALDGSSYSEDDNEKGFFALLIAFFVAVLGGLIFLGVEQARGRIYKKSFFGARKVEGYFREAPLSGYLPSAWYLLQDGGRFYPQGEVKNLVSAYFLKWVLEGYLRVVPDEKSSKRVNLVFKEEFDMEDSAELSLYVMALEAAGSNAILEKGEFARWSGKHVDRINAWPGEVKSSGRARMSRDGFKSGNALTPEGQAAAANLLKFKNFLKDFTITNEREAVEVGLWKDYLVYAGLFGIADKVAKQFQKLYPLEFQEYTKSVGMDGANLLRTITYTNYMSTSMMNRVNGQNAAGSIKGLGGHTSFGGGGGFSGGGFGGGSR